MTSSPDSSASAMTSLGGAERENVVGLDLSLTSTGIAVGVTMTVKPKTTGYQRLRAIRERVLHAVELVNATLVVVEGPSYGSVGNGQHERGGLWWMVTDALDAAGYPLAVVAPAALKKYATGTGNAKKDAVIVAACRRFPDFAGGNDEADALWLRAMGCDSIGSPLADMPAKNREALTAVQWPVTA